MCAHFKFIVLYDIQTMNRPDPEMKVKAHIVIEKGYIVGIRASQWKDEMLVHTEEYNEEYHGETYLSKPRQRAVVTIEFEVPDSVFEREPAMVIQGEVVPSSK